MNAVAEIDHEQSTAVGAPREMPGAVVPATTMEMISYALAQGASIDMVERVMALHERAEATKARKAFDAAIAEAKAEIEPVVRNATGHNDKRYADFAAIARAVDPVISRHGLSYRFRTNQTDRISVTCVLSHRDGHSEETTLSGPPDTSGNKNAIQAIGSTLTYLQRYSLVQALGLAAANDDDGKASEQSQAISEDQLAQLIDLIEAVEADATKFARFMKVDRLADLPAREFDRAAAELKKFADRRRQ